MRPTVKAVLGMVAVGALLASHWFAFTTGEDLAHARAGERLAEVQRELEQRAKDAEAEARRIEQQRANDFQEVANDAQIKIDQARRDAAAAGAAAVGLRHRVQTLAAACGAAGSHSAAADPGEAAGTAGNLLADLFGRVDQAAGEIAAAADAARAAGEACERAHGALIGG